jgi:hypothetical protein
VDGKESEVCLGVGEGTPIFSPDSTRVAFIAQEARGQRVVVDGVSGELFDGVLFRSVCYSPDSLRLAYGAKQAGSWTVVVNGQTSREFDGFPKGGRLQFISDTTVSFVYREGVNICRSEVRA